MNEMRQLEAKAVQFIEKNARWMRCELFYRDKTREYYDYCRYQCNGYLPPILKNKNGDPASPINGCVEGLFLGIGVDRKTGKLPSPSQFGNLRFHIPIRYLHWPDFNLYFADLYCHVGAKSHHLTLVLTRAKSAADIFCRARLPQLNITDNPFLYRDPMTGCMMHTTAAWIHIFYTETIPINAGWFETVNCVSARVKMGKPKNASCPVCNI